MKPIFIRISIAGLLLFLNFFCYAQNIFPSCGWPRPATDAASSYKREIAEKKIQQLIQRNQVLDSDTLYALPVVVHVIHTGTPVGSADNPSDAQINAMLVSLNNAWRKTGGPYGGADMKIQFQLAVRSPDCTGTNGINRVNGSGIANYLSGGIGINGFPGTADQSEVKNLSRWSNTDYINIWIVHKINGSAVGIGGYAYFAENVDAALDGIVMNAFYVNGTSKIINHEMGHVFELYHTFYDDGAETNCPRADSCSFYGDRVCDTEGSLVSFSCANNSNSCTGAAYAISDPAKNYSVLNNYMNYTNCPWMFSEGQKARVRAALLAFRPGLITSGGLLPPAAGVPTASCIPTAGFGLSPFYGVGRVLFNTLNIYSNSSEGDRTKYVDHTCNQQTIVFKGQTYPLQIAGSYSNFHIFKAFIDYNNDGDFDDAGELLLTEFNDTATANILIPTTGVQMNTPLRLRIVADNPAPGFPTVPTACQLNGTFAEGSGQVEDFAVTVATGPIQSVASGAWNNPSTWDCNCVPSAYDLVKVKTGHTVQVTAAMGLIECTRLLIETGASFTLGNNALFRQRK